MEKFRVIKPFRDKFTKVDLVVGYEGECDEETLKNRIKLGLVERIEKNKGKTTDKSMSSTKSK